MVKNRVGGSRHSQTIRWMTTLALLVFSIGSAQAGVVLNSCTYCHGMPPKDNVRKGNPHFDSNSSATVGSHLKHLAAVPAATDCVVCHGTVVSTYDHQNNVINMAPSISGGSYGKGVFFNQTALPVLNATATCNNTTCHGSASPTWGNNTSFAPCTKCHGVSGTSPAQYSADNKTAAPGYVSTAPVGTGRDTGGATAATAPKVGAHNVHLAAAPNYSAPMACNICHKDVNPTNASFTGHMNGAGTVVFFGLATTNHPVNPIYNGTSCTNTYCHFGKSIGGYAPATANASVAWTDTSYLTGTPSLAGDCSKCHLSPPATSGSHTTGMLIGSCSGCHPHVNSDGTFNDKNLHINGKVEGAGKCIDCHAIAQGSRSAVIGEFGLAWGHKKTGRGAVTDADCIVCHLEGAYSTQKPSDTFHKNGNIDLRDPDALTGEVPIKNIAGNTWTFKRFSTSFAANSRTSSATAETIPNIISQKFCLKCHDGDGALGTPARTSVGSQYMPWGGTTGASYTVANGAAALNGLVNVAAQFATTNSSRHPVLGPLNRDYPTAARLNVPYKPTGTRGTSGTLSQGVVINCFDCHNITGASPLTTRTVSAHGNAVTVRGVPAVFGTASVTNQASLCIVCHAGYNTVTTVDHGNGSAAGTLDTFEESAKNAYIRWGCNLCHSSTYTSTATAVRPVRAMDVHGSNVVPNGVVTKLAGSRWAGGGGPIAFIRNSNQFNNHNPKKVGATTYTPQCMGGNSGSFSACNRNSNETYAPAGTY